MPFAVDRRDGVLTLTLETPGSPVNVFNHATAHQLIEILADVTPETTRAVVFATAKTNSFINGVGLLLAQAARNDEDVVRASTPPWTAYRMVHDLPVPTIALIEGNCFGCGVEFVLGCDYRLAADTWETQFYMTELNDYLFMPLFGSTWNLPETVGLAASIDLLLWGERWDGTRAFEHGLVDEVAPYEQLDARSAALIDRVLAGTQASRRRGRVAWSEHEDAVVERARRRIEALPPLYQPLYSQALELLESGARQTHGYLGQQKRELAASGESALSPMGKAAYGFFYIRQIATERAGGRARGGAPGASFAVDVDPGSAAERFVDDLRARRLRNIRFDGGAKVDFRLVDALTESGEWGFDEVVIEAELGTGRFSGQMIYAPGYPRGGRLVELALAPDDEVRGEPANRLAQALQRLGFEVARTSPRAMSPLVSFRLLIAYLAPLACYVGQGGDPRVVNATLRSEGYLRLPSSLLRPGDHLVAAGSVRGLVIPLLECSEVAASPAEPVLIDALCLSFLAAVQAAREEREIRDPSISDLIARELIDFPRHHGSLGVWLKKSRVARALDRAAARDLVSEATVEAAAAFVAAGREIYR